VIGAGFSIAEDEAGSTAVEAAFAVPVFVMLIIGILQMGMAMIANAGVRQAVEVGARYATMYVKSPSHSDMYPTDAEITAKVAASVYGMPAASLSVPTPVRGTDATNGQKYVEVSASYPYTLKFLGLTGTAITLSHTRRVYLMPS